MPIRPPEKQQTYGTFCYIHNQSYTSYCKQHACPCCPKCKTEKHAACLYFKTLDAGSVKNKYTDLKEMKSLLQQLLINCQNIKEDQNCYALRLKRQTQQINDGIAKMRNEINDHLDKLQKKLLSELYNKESVESTKIQEVLSEIEVKEKVIQEMKENVSLMTRNTPDKKEILAKMEPDIRQYEIYIQSLVDKGTLSYITLTYPFKSIVQDFQQNITIFGEIISESGVQLDLQDIQQAQCMVLPSSVSINDITMSLRKEIKTSCTLVTGCDLLSEDSILLGSSGSTGKLLITDMQGRNQFELDGCCVLGVACIDPDTVAVSKLEGILDIIKVADKTILQTIKVSYNIQGISYDDGTLLCCALNKGVIRVSLRDEKVTTIMDCQISRYSNITTNGKSIYFTSGRGGSTVTCCDLQGNIKWYCKQPIIHDVQGITVDRYGNSYVTVFDSGIVVLISSDGKQCKTLSSKSKGMSSPSVIHYDKGNNKLVVACWMGSIFLFDVHQSSKK